MSLIELHNVGVSYDGYPALVDASLTISEGDFIGVIGPNGGGKTTLIKAILGSVPYSGKITYSEQLEHNGELKIGYMPQINAFDRSFPISIEEVVLSGLQARRAFQRYNREDFGRVRSLLQRAGIEQYASRPIGEVSGGQLQRALLCRAIISNPKLLILDEPTNFVDNRFESEMYALLQELNERMAIIIVSHDVGTITSVVKHIVCVNQHLHRHNSNIITSEHLQNYNCPIQIISHGTFPHTVLEHHAGDGCCSKDGHGK